LSCQLNLVVVGASKRQLGRFRGLDPGVRSLSADPHGRRLKAWGLAQEDLPYFIVREAKSPGTVVLALRVSPVPNDQALVGTVLATLHSLPGGIAQ
jgi:hypothetical protein